MKYLRVFSSINASSGPFFNRGIQTGKVVLVRHRTKGKLPQRIDYEPGLRHRQAAMGENFEFSENVEGDEDFDENVDLSTIEQVYDMDKLEQEQERKRIGHIITAKKFFKSPPQPMTLTCNERECIRFLHKSDPLQWNVETLSESFPATPEAIKKVLRGKFNLDPERKKKYDKKVQHNWELLAQGKLKAEPEVLEHLKKFVNRKEVLLEQMKNLKFYLPETKEEPVWNQGEMSGILGHYEKAVEKLVQRQGQGGTGLLSDGSQNERKSSLERVGEKMDRFRYSENMEGKESFNFGGMISTYSKPVTLTDLEEKLVLKADKKNQLHDTEKAFLESGLGVKAESHCTKPQSENLTLSESFSSKNLKQKKYIKTKTILSLKEKNVLYDEKKLEKLILNEENKEVILPDSRTQFVQSNELGKFFNKAEIKVDEDTRTCEKTELDLGKAEREKEYFEAQVKDVEKTCFWGDSRTSEEKAVMESEKGSLGGPSLFGRGNFFNRDVYPEKIKIPKDKRGSGLTFRVKDCFYDDDGEFLYRVPGIIKRLKVSKINVAEEITCVSDVILRNCVNQLDEKLSFDITIINSGKMACVACFVWPILLFIWYKFCQPFVLKFWNSKKICHEKSNLAAEGGDNENNINKCQSDRMENEQISNEIESMKKDD